MKKNSYLGGRSTVRKEPGAYDWVTVRCVVEGESPQRYGGGSNLDITMKSEVGNRWAAIPMSQVKEYRKQEGIVVMRRWLAEKENLEIIK